MGNEPNAPPGSRPGTSPGHPHGAPRSPGGIPIVEQVVRGLRDQRAASDGNKIIQLNGSLQEEHVMCVCIYICM